MSESEITKESEPQSDKPKETHKQLKKQEKAIKLEYHKLRKDSEVKIKAKQISNIINEDNALIPFNNEAIQILSKSTVSLFLI